MLRKLLDLGGAFGDFGQRGPAGGEGLDLCQQRGVFATQAGQVAVVARRIAQRGLDALKRSSAVVTARSASRRSAARRRRAAGSVSVEDVAGDLEGEGASSTEVVTTTGTLAAALAR